MPTDIRDELDRSFGAGPAHPTVQVDLAAGRRALRRRRLAAAAAVACVVAVAGTAYAVIGAGEQPGAGSEVAVEPPAPAWQRGELVRYVDGELEVRPGVTVHERLDNPYGLRAPDRSDALDVTFEGQRTWVLAELRDGESSTAASAPSNGWSGFGAWVDDQVGGTGDGWPETVELTTAGEIVAAPGAEILQRTDDPRLGEAFAAPGETTGAALVRVDGETGSYFVVWRVVDGTLDVLTTPPRDTVGATFEELLAFARGQYDSGEGLR